MNKFSLGILLGLLAGCAATLLVLHQRAPAPGSPVPEAPAAAPEKPKENPLHVPAAKRTAAGIAVARPKSITVPASAEGFGRVLDPTTLVALAAELQSAEASETASEHDATRLKKLAETGGNASAQAREIAEATFQRDQIAVLSARARLQSGWGGALANDAKLQEVLPRLQGGEMLVRIDSLTSIAVSASKSIHIEMSGGDVAADAEILGPVPSVDPQLQGAGILALAPANKFPIGATLRAAVPAAGEAQTGFSVPRSAIVYHEGSAWVYVLGEEDTFERKLVTLGHGVAPDVLVLSGLEETNQVVTAGAGQLLSAELQAGGAPDES